MSKENAIIIDQLTKVYGEQVVLDKLSFNIPKNSITTILGFSGAGKSTLLKHILGLVRPTSGTISVLGQDLSTFSPVKLMSFRRNFGMLFQYAALFDYMSAFENVAFPMREFLDESEEMITKKTAALLESVGIEEISFYKVPAQLSGGMRKRVGLARALALSPSIMLYDEPTTGLDPITTKMVNDLIVQTAKINNGMTSLIISHDVRATLKISDYVAFLDKGRIVEYLPVQEFEKSSNPYVRKFLDL